MKRNSRYKNDEYYYYFLLILLYLWSIYKYNDDQLRGYVCLYYCDYWDVTDAWENAKFFKKGNLKKLHPREQELLELEVASPVAPITPDADSPVHL